MLMHQIEVDDEVFTYLKTKAEPFVDTPNDVLRRELFKEIQPVIDVKSDDWPIYRAGTTETVKQILDVLYLVKRKRIDRRLATNLVAKKYNVYPQTVNSKYARGLGIKTYEFDRLLQSENCEKLISMLVSRFPRESDQISQYF